ncbi:chaperonin 10-like protein [Stachybotrys elegans]|uniref:Chaperonin 10-like protein n=1 Tax=Stachybotrys elegans TaxID=80388 RepID=A0A8K0SR17_9HYPO|nr:chaperonin 10-like protein [Stachybotrys elegans]
MATHLAAVNHSKGQPFVVRPRPTPKPGPGELLIAVKSVALNPADHIMSDTGLFVSVYPTVIGFDMAGLVLEVGEGVPTSAADSASAIFFQPGLTRVAAYGAFFWRSSNPDYGPFQEQCLVPWQHAVPLPEGISWSHAATLPVSVQVPLSAWDALGIPRLGESPKKHEGNKEALLIWGASSSVGTMGVQAAKLLRDDTGSAFAAVYATAGSANRDYVRSLGADRVFDYKDPNVVDAITAAAREDGLAIRHCFLAIGDITSCQAVLKASLAQDKEVGTAKIASAPVIPADLDTVDGVETMFLMPSAVEEERLEQFRYWLGTWLRTNLEKGTVRPSPDPTVVGKGLEAINAGLDRLRQGVSCTKLVVEIAE